jgi:hypothetical protein
MAHLEGQRPAAPRQLVRRHLGCRPRIPESEFGKHRASLTNYNLTSARARASKYGTDSYQG